MEQHDGRRLCRLPLNALAEVQKLIREGADLRDAYYRVVSRGLVADGTSAMVMMRSR
jgi:hypothetical protein